MEVYFLKNYTLSFLFLILRLIAFNLILLIIYVIIFKIIFVT